ncbi:MAG: 1-deoxy-D-xylulose-5-phosphate reductoisomerase [Actinomycetota bacterium]
MDLFATPERLRVAVLGSTGSIGRQALEVARAHPDRFQIVALAAGSDGKTLAAQAGEFGVSLLGIVNGDTPVPDGARVLRGPRSAEQVVEECDAHIVLNAVVGSAGLLATMATIATGRTLALANKESLVAGGELVMSKVMEGQLRPVDSEHSALWQLLNGLPADQVRKVVITGSGGPFRGKTAAELAGVTLDQALKHPVWSMGPKITIDSSTLMNKGLEVIEAHFLFGLTYDEIEVVIHPQGLIHGMVEAWDGALYAHAAPPDMRLPIQLALSWPDRLGAAAGRIDWSTTHQMTFEPADTGTFRCLDLAYHAGRLGGTYPAVLNAANEAAVGAFIDHAIDYLGIPWIVEQIVEEHSGCEPVLDAILEQDAWARRRALELSTQRRPS